jgi:hypothetical protein
MQQLSLPLTTDIVDFGVALQWLRMGERVTRTEWNGGKWLEITDVEYVRCGHHRKAAVIDVVQEDDAFTSWQPDQTDILANDWRLAK